MRPLIDPILEQLLQVLGGALSDAFLDQLRIDLASARAAQRRAVAGHDRDGLRRAAHDLIALAGTLGARALEMAVWRMNATAHDPDHAAFGQPAQLVGHLTDRLAAELDAVRARHGTGTTPSRCHAG